MASFLTNDLALYFSKTREASYNAGVASGANYSKIRTTQPQFLLPQIEFVNDANRPGNGHEFATEWCASYITQPAFSVTDDINFGIAGRLALRALGGTVTSAQQGSTTAYKHSCNMLPIASGRQLPSFSAASELGGASFKMDGMVVDSYRVSQTRADRPQYSVNVIGSGKHTTPHGLTSLPATMDTVSCLNGNATEVYWTDSSGTTTFSGVSCVLRSWFIDIANNSRTNDRCAGDLTQTMTYNSTTTYPAYVSKTLRGSRVVTAQIQILLDSTIVPWERYVTGQELTNITFKAQSSSEAGTGYKYGVNFIIPKARIQSIESGDSDGDAALTINLLGMYDSISGGAVKCEVINQETSNYV